MVLPQGPNQRWSLDFQSDALADGRRFRIFLWSTITRGNAWPDRRHLAAELRVVRELDAIVTSGDDQP